MDEIEFAQKVAGRLSKKTRENVLQSLQSQGFGLDGFRSMRKVPVEILQASLKKTIRNSKQSTASIFLKEVRDSADEDDVINIVRRWFGNEDERLLAEEQIVNEQNKKEKQQNNTIKNNADRKEQDNEITKKLEEQKNKNQSLQQKIQDLKRRLDDTTNDLLTEQKKNKKITKENITLQKSIKQYEEDLKKYNKENVALTEKVTFYEDVLNKRSKILCFTKAPIPKEYIILCNIEAYSDLANLENINWSQYKRIYVSESDFPIDKIQLIGSLSGKHVEQARNIIKLIERLI